MEFKVGDKIRKINGDTFKHGGDTVTIRSIEDYMGPGKKLRFEETDTWVSSGYVYVVNREIEAEEL